MSRCQQDPAASQNRNWWSEDQIVSSPLMKLFSIENSEQCVKALSHLTDLARRSNTGVQICRFSGIGTSTAAQRYHIGKNGSTSAGHRQNIGDKISNGRRWYKFLNMLKNLCRCATGASNRTTTAILRYGFVNVGRAPVEHRYCPVMDRRLSGGLNSVPYWYRCDTVVLPMY